MSEVGSAFADRQDGISLAPPSLIHRTGDHEEPLYCTANRVSRPLQAFFPSLRNALPVSQKESRLLQMLFPASNHAITPSPTRRGLSHTLPPPRIISHLSIHRSTHQSPTAFSYILHTEPLMIERQNGILNSGIASTPVSFYVSPHASSEHRKIS